MHFLLRRHRLAAFLLISASLLYPAPPAISLAQEQESKTDPLEEGDDETTLETLQRAAEQLSSDSYRLRQIGSRRLELAGDAAVPILRQAVQSGDLELSVRAIKTLQRIAMTSEPDEEDLAYETLMQLSGRGISSVSGRAGDAIEELRRRRARLAEEKLENAGIDIGYGTIVERNRSANETVRRLEIPPDWTGPLEPLAYCKWLFGYHHALLAGPRIDAAVMKQVALLPELQILVTHDTPQLDIAAITHLQQSDQLVHVELRYNGIGTAGLDALANIPVRQSLWLIGTNVPPAALPKLKAMAGGISVEIRSGAFLGISGMNRERQCVIMSVTPDSAAAEAGLMPGDVVIDVGGTPIDSFEDLQEAIGSKKPYEPVGIVVVRDGQRVETEVRLKTMTLK